MAKVCCWRKSGIPPEGFKVVPPDGKWGWMVLLGCVVCATCCITCNIAFGFAMNDMIFALKTDTATISWALAIASGLGNLVGPLVTIFINNFSCRTSAILGGLICSMGMVSSAYVTRVEILFFTFGILTGVGKKMVVTPVSIVICLYFKKYLAITMGIVTAAYAGSRLLMSPLIQLILQEYGFRGLLLIVGGLTLNMSLGASLFQPVNWHSRLVPVEVEIKNHDANGRVNPEEKNIIVGDKNDNCPTSDIQCVSLTSKIPAEHKSEMVTLMKETKFKMETTEISCNSVVHNRQMSINLASSWDIFAELGMEPCKDCDKYRDATNKKKRRWSFRDALLKSIDLTLLKEGVFYVICFDSALMTTTAIYMSIYIFHAGIELGLYPMQAAGLASTRAFGEMSGRLIGPLLITILKLKIAPTYIVCLFLHGITLIILSYLTSVAATYSIGGVISGLVIGAGVGIQGILVVEIVGVKRFSSVLGLISFFQGFFLFIMGPFIGWFRDTTGSYVSCVLFLGSLQFIHSGLWIFHELYKTRFTINSNV